MSDGKSDGKGQAAPQSRAANEGERGRFEIFDSIVTKLLVVMSQDCDNIYKESVTERPVAELLEDAHVGGWWTMLACSSNV